MLLRQIPPLANRLQSLLAPNLCCSTKCAAKSPLSIQRAWRPSRGVSKAMALMAQNQKYGGVLESGPGYEWVRQPHTRIAEGVGTQNVLERVSGHIFEQPL